MGKRLSMGLMALAGVAAGYLFFHIVQQSQQPRPNEIPMSLAFSGSDFTMVGSQRLQD